MSTLSAAQRTANALVEMRDVTKYYGRFAALRSVDLRLAPGQILGLIGENGAGKSTLVKILAGLESIDSGVVHFADSELADGVGARGKRRPVALVQQELSLVPTESIAENVALGGTGPGAVWTRGRLRKASRAALEAVGLGDHDPLRPAGHLTIAEQQLAEIARVIARDAKVVIFDEPTATLSDLEIERVHAVVRRLASERRGVIYVSHRLSEVFEMCHDLLVLRDGQVVLNRPASDLTVDTVIEAMLGRRLQQFYPPRPSLTDEEIYVGIDSVTTQGLVDPVSIAVGKGEILGLAGQIGSGASNLVRLLAGVQSLDTGMVTLGGDEIRLRNPREAKRAGIGYVSDDRKRDGIFAIRSVGENLTAPSLRSISRHAILSKATETQLSERLAGNFAIDLGRLRVLAGQLSGGNQQKVALGKWASIKPRLLLFEEPTRGVDVGAKAEIYKLLRQLADEGIAIIFSSSDLAEVLGVADRVVTFYRGRVVGNRRSVDYPEAEAVAHITHPSSNSEDSA